MRCPYPFEIAPGCERLSTVSVLLFRAFVRLETAARVFCVRERDKEVFEGSREAKKMKECQVRGDFHSREVEDEVTLINDAGSSCSFP